MCRRGQRAIAGREQPSYAPGLMSVLLRCILGVWARWSRELGPNASQELQELLHQGRAVIRAHSSVYSTGLALRHLL